MKTKSEVSNKMIQVPNYEELFDNSTNGLIASIDSLKKAYDLFYESMNSEICLGMGKQFDKNWLKAQLAFERASRALGSLYGELCALSSNCLTGD